MMDSLREYLMSELKVDEDKIEDSASNIIPAGAAFRHEGALIEKKESFNIKNLPKSHRIDNIADMTIDFYAKQGYEFVQKQRVGLTDCVYMKKGETACLIDLYLVKESKQENTLGVLVSAVSVEE